MSLISVFVGTFLCDCTFLTSISRTLNVLLSALECFSCKQVGLKYGFCL